MNTLSALTAGRTWTIQPALLTCLVTGANRNRGQVFTAHVGMLKQFLAGKPEED